MIKFNKLFIIFFTLCLYSSFSNADSFPKKMKFNGKKFKIKHSAKKNNQSIAEYLLKRDSLESYSKMISSMNFKDFKYSALKAAKNLVVKLEKDKEDGKNHATYFIIQSNDNKNLVYVDFVVSKKETSKVTTEYNLMLFDTSKKNMQVRHFIQRFYYTKDKTGKELDAFLKMVSDSAHRKRLMHELNNPKNKALFFDPF